MFDHTEKTGSTLTAQELEARAKAADTKIEELEQRVPDLKAAIQARGRAVEEAGGDLAADTELGQLHNQLATLRGDIEVQRIMADGYRDDAKAARDGEKTADGKQKISAFDKLHRKRQKSAAKVDNAIDNLADAMREFLAASQASADAAPANRILLGDNQGSLNLKTALLGEHLFEPIIRRMIEKRILQGTRGRGTSSLAEHIDAQHQQIMAALRHHFKLT